METSCKLAVFAAGAVALYWALGGGRKRKRDLTYIARGETYVTQSGGTIRRYTREKPPGSGIFVEGAHVQSTDAEDLLHAHRVLAADSAGDITMFELPPGETPESYHGRH